MVFQSYALFPLMSVAENVAYPLKIRGLRKADIAAKELLLQSELAKTLAAGATEEAAKIQRQLTDEIRRFEEKREREKDAVRSEA